MDQSHSIHKIGKINIPHFDYVEYGIKGVGKKKIPIIPMDEFIDHDQDEFLHLECCKGLALSKQTKFGSFYGDIPPEETLRFNKNQSFSNFIKNIKEKDHTGKHLKVIEEIIETLKEGDSLEPIYKYIHFALGAPIPWFFLVYLKYSDFSKKTQKNDEYTENVKYFPNVINYIKTLPFKFIGRIVFLTTYPHSGVVTHRDYPVREHKDHSINLFFDFNSRPTYIWNEITKEKIYLQKNSKSYFFNNRDYHGVDPEPVFRYTLRIDGTFTDELCEKLELEDGYTWKWSYEKNEN